MAKLNTSIRSRDLVVLVTVTFISYHHYSISFPVNQEGLENIAKNR